MLFKWLASRFRKTASDPPVVVSCHDRIETRGGYDTYRRAKLRGDRFLRVRYLGCSHFDSVPIGRIDPSRFEKTAAELERPC